VVPQFSHLAFSSQAFSAFFLSKIVGNSLSLDRLMARSGQFFSQIMHPPHRAESNIRLIESSFFVNSIA
jgi:hypothetical protein